MFNLENWRSFKGAGLIPGIKDVIITKPDNDTTIIGTVFYVKNNDGSEHEEEIIEYIPGQFLSMKLHKFGKPLKLFATHFYEKWIFEEKNHKTYFSRTFEMYPKNFIGSLILILISSCMRKAVEKHSRMIK